MKKPSRKRILAVSAALVLLAWLCCLPRTLFRDVPYSTVVEARDGNLLGARIATDGQWRFPPRDTVPETDSGGFRRGTRFRRNSPLPSSSLKTGISDGIRASIR